MLEAQRPKILSIREVDRTAAVVRSALANFDRGAALHPPWKDDVLDGFAEAHDALGKREKKIS